MENWVSFALSSIAVLFSGLGLLISFSALRISKRQEKRREANFLIYLKGSSEYWNETGTVMSVELDLHATNLSDSKDSLAFAELILDFKSESGVVFPVKTQLTNSIEGGRRTNWTPISFEVRETKNLRLLANISQSHMPSDAVVERHQFCLRTANGTDFIQQFEPFDAQSIL